MHSVFSGSLRIDRLSQAIAKLPEPLSGTRIVQLSDLHYDGLRLSDRLLQRAIAASNDLDPDLVVLTGDFVTTDPEPIWDLVVHLKQLKSRAGVYAVLGNHDLCRRRSRSQIVRAFESIDVPVLWNQTVYPLGEGLAVVGLPDFWSPEFDPELAFAGIDDDTPRLVLSHNPDSAAVLKPWRVDLQLSGHTHGGQIIIPGLGALALVLDPIRRITPKPWRPYIPYLAACRKVVTHWEWAYGLHEVGNNRLYVNRGLGTYLPGRVFCPPELTVLTLNRAKSPSPFPRRSLSST